MAGVYDWNLEKSAGGPWDPAQGHSPALPGLQASKLADTIRDPSLVPQQTDAPFKDKLQTNLDAIALGTSTIPGVGDVSGLLADSTNMLLNPEERTWGNLGWMLAGVAPFVPSLAARRVFDQGGEPVVSYHGTGARFAPEPGKPYGGYRSDKIGSGEGTQAFGYGFYDAQRPRVSVHYQNETSPSTYEIGGFRLPEHPDPEIRAIFQKFANPGNNESIWNPATIAWAAEEYAPDDATRAIIERGLSQGAEITPEGYLYTVHKSPDFVNALVDHQLKIGDMSEDTQERLQAIVDMYPDEFEAQGVTQYAIDPHSMLGKQMLDPDFTGQDIHAILDEDVGYSFNDAIHQDAVSNLVRHLQGVESMDNVADLSQFLMGQGKLGKLLPADPVTAFAAANREGVADPHVLEQLLEFYSRAEGENLKLGTPVLAGGSGSGEAALLREVGIPGWKFSDATSRNLNLPAGHPNRTSNYVTTPGFEDNVRIVDRHFGNPNRWQPMIDRRADPHPWSK